MAQGEATRFRVRCIGMTKEMNLPIIMRIGETEPSEEKKRNLGIVFGILFAF